MNSQPDLSILKGNYQTLKPELLHKLFQNVATKNGDKVALIFKESNKTHITNYAKLNAKSSRLARGILKVIQDESILPNENGDYIVAVSMGPSDRLIECLLAIWKSGAAYLPLDPEFPETRVQHILNEARPVLMIHNEQDVEIYCQDVRKVSYAKVMDLGAQTIQLIPVKSSYRPQENLAIVLYTYGSTGVPKVVRKSHAALHNKLQWQWTTFPYSKTELVGVFKTCITSLDSDCEIWGTLLSGLALLIVPKNCLSDTGSMIKLLTDYKIERLILSPYLLQSILLFLSLNKDSDLLPNLRLWICTGEQLPISLAKDFYKTVYHPKPVLCYFYGSSEVMGHVTYFISQKGGYVKEENNVPIGHQYFGASSILA